MLRAAAARRLLQTGPSNTLLGAPLNFAACRADQPGGAWAGSGLTADQEAQKGGAWGPQVGPASH